MPKEFYQKLWQLAFLNRHVPELPLHAVRIRYQHARQRPDRRLDVVSHPRNVAAVHRDLRSLDELLHAVSLRVFDDDERPSICEI